MHTQSGFDLTKRSPDFIVPEPAEQKPQNISLHKRSLLLYTTNRGNDLKHTRLSGGGENRNVRINIKKIEDMDLKVLREIARKVTQWHKKQVKV